MNLIEIVEMLRKVKLGCLLAGIIGNLIVFLVFSRKSFQNNSVNIYCRALAISDSLIILLQIPTMVSIIFYGSDIYATSDAICKFTLYAAVFLPPISSWNLVVFALDKLACVMFPNRYKTLLYDVLSLNSN